MSSPERTTDTTPLHGLRTIFNISVVICHAQVFLSLAFDHPSDARKLVTGSIPAHILSFVNTLSNISVDVFLLLSGFLLKSHFSKVPHTPSTAIRYTIFRYLRLAPAYLTISFLISSGNPNCITWSELSLLSLGDTLDRCIAVGWSTSIDFWSHIILVPFLSYPNILVLILMLTPPLRLWSFMRRGSPKIPIPATMQDFISADDLDKVAQWLSIPRGNFSVTDPELIRRKEIYSQVAPLYFGLQYRIAAVVVGILLYSYMREKNIIYHTIRKFPTLSMSCVAVGWGLYHIVEQQMFAPDWVAVVHSAVKRMMISFATSVIVILACTIDDYPSQHWVSQWLRTVLSCRVFRFLHRFSYVVYLFHAMTASIMATWPPKMSRDRIVAGWVLVAGLKLYVGTLVLGLPIWGVEWMALRARRLLLNRISGRVENEEKEKVA